MYTFLNRKWFFDKFYNECINQPIMRMGHHQTYKVLDRGVFEIFGPFGISNLLYKTRQKVVTMQTGLIYHYAFLMLMGLTFFVLVIGLSDQ
jgi:NADH:ubiquinone oxidoreductase subunit 5 (subunit L)/multisubunit Na+/H+ antiporter MnhA subunit